MTFDFLFPLIHDRIGSDDEGETGRLHVAILFGVVVRRKEISFGLSICKKGGGKRDVSFDKKLTRLTKGTCEVKSNL